MSRISCQSPPTHMVVVVIGPSGGITVNLKSIPARGVQSMVFVSPIQAQTAGHCAHAMGRRPRALKNTKATNIFSPVKFMLFCLEAKLLGVGLIT